ncbi:hypothetical protein [Paenibacillus agilis]|uniref:Uncharacterized protein n=1 Tax=Paenibacillus agilis TaxID=3020863 RepID=A0A559J2N0_9BACL|nr:hypothetical protein [Paenibacillus agilis]TVX94140.1 hypothetical protein FPZ44_14410 [Paenibacillus agilis]
MMSAATNPMIETEEDIQMIKEYTLFPILLDMLARDMEGLMMYKNKIVYHHVLGYLKEVEHSIYPELRKLKAKMRARNIKILNTEMNALGIDIEYKVRGYIHRFTMLRGLVKAELMTMLMNVQGRVR